ncbi:hypothetical protein AYL99_11709 [Fonsecaea erecta]|uniref:Uncharacterized protein n=1 Tax=Fonsecaea erecta TaxID=1367422 RepID=A0A178Z3A2_9EURO|nr:hypothetical protein AYL99_11709 [Fonsecaea erecta]OAP54174.1 hypothetical protein AYL99_11709 [Fonsecaea erecta]
MSFIWCYFRLPKTKHRPVEEIDYMPEHWVTPRDFKRYKVDEDGPKNDLAEWSSDSAHYERVSRSIPPLASTLRSAVKISVLPPLTPAWPLLAHLGPRHISHE